MSVPEIALIIVGWTVLGSIPPDLIGAKVGPVSDAVNVAVCHPRGEHPAAGCLFYCFPEGGGYIFDLSRWANLISWRKKRHHSLRAFWHCEQRGPEAVGLTGRYGFPCS